MNDPERFVVGLNEDRRDRREVDDGVVAREGEELDHVPILEVQLSEDLPDRLDLIVQVGTVGDDDESPVAG